MPTPSVIKRGSDTISQMLRYLYYPIVKASNRYMMKSQRLRSEFYKEYHSSLERDFLRVETSQPVTKNDSECLQNLISGLDDLSREVAYPE